MTKFGNTMEPYKRVIHFDKSNPLNPVFIGRASNGKNIRSLYDEQHLYIDNATISGHHLELVSKFPGSKLTNISRFNTFVYHYQSHSVEILRDAINLSAKYYILGLSIDDCIVKDGTIPTWDIFEACSLIVVINRDFVSKGGSCYEFYVSSPSKFLDLLKEETRFDPFGMLVSEVEFERSLDDIFKNADTFKPSLATQGDSNIYRNSAFNDDDITASEADEAFEAVRATCSEIVKDEARTFSYKKPQRSDIRPPRRTGWQNPAHISETVVHAPNKKRKYSEIDQSEKHTILLLNTFTDIVGKQATEVALQKKELETLKRRKHIKKIAGSFLAGIVTGFVTIAELRRRR